MGCGLHGDSDPSEDNYGGHFSPKNDHHVNKKEDIKQPPFPSNYDLQQGSAPKKLKVIAKLSSIMQQRPKQDEFQDELGDLQEGVSTKHTEVFGISSDPEMRDCSSILIWTCLVQLVAVGELWHPKLFIGFSNPINGSTIPTPPPALPPLPPPRNYISNGFLKVSCNGGLNQMRAAICDMVTVARLLNLTLVVLELDKTSFWADPSDFEDIFYVGHFIDSLRDEVRIVKRLPKRFSRKYGFQPLP